MRPHPNHILRYNHRTKTAAGIRLVKLITAKPANPWTNTENKETNQLRTTFHLRRLTQILKRFETLNGLIISKFHISSSVLTPYISTDATTEALITEVMIRSGTSHRQRYWPSVGKKKVPIYQKLVVRVTCFSGITFIKSTRIQSFGIKFDGRMSSNSEYPKPSHMPTVKIRK